MSDLKQHEIELYKQTLEKHIDALHSTSQLYDRAILSLSTAALGFTFVALNKLLPVAVKHCCLLAFTWFFLIISILFVLISFLLDQHHCQRKITHCYWRITNKGDQVGWSHWTDYWIVIVPVVAGAFFIIGIILFTIFVSININC